MYRALLQGKRANLLNFPRPSGDWDQRELSEFYRIENALIQGGLRIFSDRGVTEEGDPWFIFIREFDDEPIIHFARIGGEYIIASAVYQPVLRGLNFQAMVLDLLTRHKLNSFKFYGSGNISTHPSALLIIFVGLAFFKVTGPAQAATLDTYFKMSEKLKVFTENHRRQELKSGNDTIFDKLDLNMILSEVARVFLIVFASNFYSSAKASDDASPLIFNAANVQSSEIHLRALVDSQIEFNPANDPSGKRSSNRESFDPNISENIPDHSINLFPDHNYNFNDLLYVIECPAALDDKGLFSNWLFFDMHGIVFRIQNIMDLRVSLLAVYSSHNQRYELASTKSIENANDQSPIYKNLFDSSAGAYASGPLNAAISASIKDFFGRGDAADLRIEVFFPNLTAKGILDLLFVRPHDLIMSNNRSLDYATEATEGFTLYVDGSSPQLDKSINIEAFEIIELEGSGSRAEPAKELMKSQSSLRDAGFTKSSSEIINFNGSNDYDTTSQVAIDNLPLASNNRDFTFSLDGEIIDEENFISSCLDLLEKFVKTFPDAIFTPIEDSGFIFQTKESFIDTDPDHKIKIDFIDGSYINVIGQKNEIFELIDLV